MAKLFFRYGSMSSGKSLDILKVNFNYLERGKKTIIFTSAKDNRYGENIVKSRIGISEKAIGVNDEMNIYDYVKNSDKIDCVLVDEVQFFKRNHILQLSDIVDDLDIPVIAYGLRSDFQLNVFEGSACLLAIADEIQELVTLCHECEKKAILNIRYVNGKIATEGEQVQIGGNESYKPLCRKCYKKQLKTN
jgi:thymidine kinase